jgi:hypothetical protein
VHRPPDIDSITDFHQYYRHAYVGWRVGDGYVPAYVQGDSGRGRISINVNNESANTGNFTEVTLPEILDRCQFGAPQYGSTEVGDTCVYVSRRSPRTPGRGHRASNLNMRVFHPEAYGAPHELILTSWDYVRALFSPRYRSLEEAFDILNRGDRLACSISRHFTGSLEEGVKYPALYYKNIPIGYLTTYGRIEVENKDLHEELVRVTFPKAQVV